MSKKFWVILAGMLLIALFSGGCGVKNQEEKAEATTREKKDYSKLVASEDEMIAIDKVVKDGMVPIEGKSLKDGTYDIKVNTSSSMFPVTDCSLTVDNGKMTAVMTMSGKGYLYLFMGTGKEAVDSDESQYIPFEEDKDGKHTFTVPVKALNEAIPCTAFSKRKEKWYNRMICFRADSLPEEAFAEGVLHTVKSLGLKDGTYTAGMTLGGGSGRAEVETPVTLNIKDGKCTAQIVWSSSNYDYMLVDGQKYDPINTEGNSTFEIPVRIFDMPIAVVGDTTAMSQPHEIEYTMTFDSSTIQEKK